MTQRDKVGLSLHGATSLACDGCHKEGEPASGTMTTPTSDGKLQAPTEDVRHGSGLSVMISEEGRRLSPPPTEEYDMKP